MHFDEADTPPSEISTKKWDNGDAWDARDKLFVPQNQRVEEGESTPRCFP